VTPRATGSGTLYVVATPIGNLADLSARARSVLSEADVIAAEDTRRARGLLSHIGANVPVIAYHDHNEEECLPGLLERLARGESVALVSDAGTPLISDPGLKLVRAARAQGVTIVSVPGPSAVLAALSSSGLPTDRFAFEGFLPRRAGARSERLRAVANDSRTLVFFEAVHRMPETLQALVETFGADRQAVLARELTKVHEQVVAGTLGQLAQRLGADVPLLGEFVIVVAGNLAAGTPDEQRAQRIFDLLQAELPPSRAVALTAQISGLPRNDVYRLTRVRD
jgi:16S rRNA (cytidine1402-2'-O)-methyltransferase